jgi:2'-5' RNA ligase
MTAEEPGAKTHLTAVVVVPPEEVWEPIQRLRRLHDPQIARWMPHITLLYPFVPAQQFDTVAPGLRDALRGQVPFRLTLAQFRHFPHGARSATLWLAPEPAAPLVRLQADLQLAFPHCDDVRQYRSGFVAHLSVGQFGGWREAESAAQRLAAEWSPLEFLVERVQLIARSGSEGDPFSVRQEFPLCGT